MTKGDLTVLVKLNQVIRDEKHKSDNFLILFCQVKILYIFKLSLTSFHEKKEYFRPFSSEEGGNKGHTSEQRMFFWVVEKWNGLAYVPGLAFVNHFLGHY